jgi:hypothetical protein
MSQQLDLFADPMPKHCQPLHLNPSQPVQVATKPRASGEQRLSRRIDPPASQRAASEAVASGMVADQNSRISAVVAQGGGWTAYEIGKATNLTNVEVSRRLAGIASVRKADASCDRKCRVSGKRLTTYWSKAVFETE